jgi:hypothetical protein
MNPPATAAPPREARAAASPARRDLRLPLRPPLARQRRRDPTGRPTRLAIAASVALHVGALLLVAALPPHEPRGTPLTGDGLPPGAPSPEYASYLEIGGWPAAAEASASDPSAPASAAPSEAVPAAPDAAPVPVSPRGPAAPGTPPARGPGAGAAAPGPGAADGGGVGGQPGTPGGEGRRGGVGVRLGPEYGDSRLVVPPTAIPPRELTDVERYLVEFHRRLQALNDSIQGDADREARLRDWTWTDRNGREWGIRDGKIVIDGKEIPIPVGAPFGDRDQENDRRRQARWREETDRQSDRIERDRYLQERNRAIRERGRTP